MKSPGKHKTTKRKRDTGAGCVSHTHTHTGAQDTGMASCWVYLGQRRLSVAQASPSHSFISCCKCCSEETLVQIWTPEAADQLVEGRKELITAWVHQPNKVERSLENRIVFSLLFC